MWMWLTQILFIDNFEFLSKIFADNFSGGVGEFVADVGKAIEVGLTNAVTSDGVIGEIRIWSHCRYSCCFERNWVVIYGGRKRQRLGVVLMESWRLVVQGNRRKQERFGRLREEVELRKHLRSDLRVLNTRENWCLWLRESEVNARWGSESRDMRESVFREFNNR